MSSRIARLGTAACAVCATLAAARAEIYPIDTFEGDFSETFNQHHTNMAVQVLDVFDETATLSNLTEDGAIKVEFSSSLNGDLVVSRGGMMAGQLGIGRWDFDQPVVRFGGYFENNSGADDATLFFYDENLSLMGTMVASVPVDGSTWVWNGWESDPPFQRIEVVGNGLINGFIWYEDLQVSYVPEPATAALFALPILLGARRRR